MPPNGNTGLNPFHLAAATGDVEFLAAFRGYRAYLGLPHHGLVSENGECFYSEEELNSMERRDREAGLPASRSLPGSYSSDAAYQAMSAASALS